MANFASILDAPITEAERPPAIPTGDYILVISGNPRRDKSTRNQTDYIEYSLKILSAVDGTYDEDELKEFEESQGKISGKETKKTFYITEKSGYRHKEFIIDDLGLEMGPDKSHWEAAQEAVGHQFLGHYTKKPSDDGKGWFSELTSTAPVE